MASQPSPTLPASERTLRMVNIVTFIPGLAFLAATGASRDYAWAWTGIAPLSLSAILALLVFVFLRGKFRKVVLALDLFLASFLLGCDIWAWAQGGYAPLVPGHAASALLVDFFVHAYLFLRNLFGLFNIRELLPSASISLRSRSGCDRCAHCASEARAKKTAVQAVGGSKETYHRVSGRDDGYDEETDGESYRDACPSTEDESASLV